MKRFFLRALLFTLGLMAILELSARFYYDNQFWYQGAERKLAHDSINYLILGNSRVAAAVDAAQFSQAMQRYSGRNVNTINLGMGGSTAAEHYYGIRRLIQRNPESFKHTYLLIEAPGGIPWDSTWQDDWLNTDHNRNSALTSGALLATNTNWEDIGKYWQLSAASTEEKLALSIAKVSQFIPRAERIKQRILEQLEDRTEKALARCGFPNRMYQVDDSKMTNAGGIRVDPAGISYARQYAVTWANEEIGNQHPAPNWNDTILKSLVDLVEANGGHVLFFEPPLSSVLAKPYKTTKCLLESKSFRETLSAWHCPLLIVPCRTEDNDFPDLWHLSRAKSPEFSDALAKSVYEVMKNSH